MVHMRSIAAAFSLSRNVNFAWLVPQFRTTEVRVSNLGMVTGCPGNLCRLMPKGYIAMDHYCFLSYNFQFLIHY
jgi:hypothetical protein